MYATEAITRHYIPVCPPFRLTVCVCVRACQSGGGGRHNGGARGVRTSLLTVCACACVCAGDRAEAEGDITAARAAYAMERERLRVICERNLAGLAELRASNRQAEAALKKRK